MKDVNLTLLFSWLIGLVVFIIGLSNLLLVHPVPGIVFLLISALHFPPADALCMKIFGRPVPFLAKVFLGFVIIWFTLGVSDLGDMIDDL
ncbi:hypothetical protein [Adhaeribacter soli]|uniref:Uncharacterized protein n=1 Tax=Adhaeribacter soli TaxID=2607655 RepID=A0A5N1IX26_9BACT|nr:hypothetical protein [Adhaeribacter soli]KAA9338844.1 hypothetical protein F0P94_08605 [Adhaeribacter soli]